MASDDKSGTAYKALLKTSKNKKHHRLNKFLKETEIISIESRQNKNLSLKFFIIKTIIGQQVSIGAAASIWAKTEKMLNNKKRISLEDLTDCGLSRPKASYVNEILSNQYLDCFTKKDLKKMNQTDISDLFLRIKGVGPWTLGIIQMFYLGQEDIYLTGDLGIKKAGLSFFKSDNYEAIDYSPYRTYLCMYLWRSLNN
jgi:DNA-3-methyladenine glycosylase II